METLIGPDFFLEHTAGAIYRGDTPWHGGQPKDTPNPITHGKIAMYFDSLGKDDGCLRIIPGSHRQPLADHLKPLSREADEPQTMFFGIADQDIPCVALETDPGDVIVFTERVYYSAYGSKIGRLQITAEYGSNPTNDEQIAGVAQIPRPVHMVLPPVGVVHQQRSAPCSANGVEVGGAGLHTVSGIAGPHL